MKKILLFFALLFSIANAHAGPMANVEYIHQVIKQHWDIDVPYNPELQNPKVAANMKYLLTAIDVANKILNGEETSDYGNSEYATLHAADTIATNTAVKWLIKIQPKFTVTTTADTAEFSFNMSTKGTFMVDWGDGNTQKIIRDNTKNTTYSHAYDTAGKYTIGIDGIATAYNASNSVAAISFKDNMNVAEIAGSLGAIFSTIGNGSASGQQPKFFHTFYNCSNLSGSIPQELFTGISGAPTAFMFAGTFWKCKSLTGNIPANLFNGVVGAPQSNIFALTFYGCRNLTGDIPENLFGGISGTPTDFMFSGTFWGCMGLTGIPENLFGDISGPSRAGMFNNTFRECENLSGESARINGTPLYEIWPNATLDDVGGCYGGATGLSDYDKIPYKYIEKPTDTDTPAQ